MIIILYYVASISEIIYFTFFSLFIYDQIVRAIYATRAMNSFILSFLAFANLFWNQYCVSEFYI